MAKRIRLHARDVSTALQRALELLNGQHLVPCQQVIALQSCVRRELNIKRPFRARGRVTRREPLLSEVRFEHLCDACKAFLHTERATSAMHAVLRVPESKVDFFDVVDPTVSEA